MPERDEDGEDRSFMKPPTAMKPPTVSEGSAAPGRRGVGGETKRYDHEVHLLFSDQSPSFQEIRHVAQVPPSEVSAGRGKWLWLLLALLVLVALGVVAYKLLT